jgi:hypothetical protein
LSDLEASVDDLRQVPLGFSSTLPLQHPLTGARAVEVDDADVALVRAAVLFAMAHAHLSAVYNVDVPITSVMKRLQAAQVDVQRDLLDPYPTLLHLQQAEQAQLAKEALIVAIDDYLDAEALMHLETDAQADDLISFSSLPEDVNKAAQFRQELTQLQRSLTGLSDAAWTLTIDQVLHLGDFFDRPLDVRLLENGHGVQQSLLTYVQYQTGRALTNLQHAPVTYSELVDPTVYNTHAGPMKEVDYGDLLAVASTLESLNAVVSLFGSYDAHVTLPELVQHSVEGGLDIQRDVLDRYPMLLRVSAQQQLLTARQSIEAAVNHVLETSHYLRVSDDSNQSDDVVPFEADVAAFDAKWSPQLQQFAQLAGLIDPDPARAGDEFRVNLGPLFDHPRDPRELLPPFQGVRPLREALPDPTLDGVLPDATLDDWPTW